MKYKDLSVVELEKKAELLEESGADFEVLDCWRTIIEREPSVYSLCRLGDLSLKLGRWEDAKHSYESATNLMPNVPLPYTRLGLLYLKLCEPEKALEYFNKSLALDENARLFTLSGVALLDQGLTTEARESFTRAIEKNPEYEEAYYNLAVTFRNENPYKAIDLFKKAIEIDPEYEIAHRELGWCLRQLMMLKDALHHLNKAIQLDNTDVWSYIYLGNTLWVNDNLVEAEKAFKKAIAVSPKDVVGYWCLAFFYERQNLNEKAKKYYQRGIELDPNDVETNLQFGIFLMQVGESQKAKTYLERVISLESDNKQARLALADLN